MRMIFLFFVAVMVVFVVAWLLNQYAAENARLIAENESLEEHNNQLWDENTHLKQYFNSIVDE